MRGILTMAFGHDRYFDQARNLVLSAQRWTDLPVAVVTDREIDFAQAIPHDPSRGKGLEQKLWIDHYSPFTETLFLDADCLVMKDPTLALEWLSTVDIGIVGLPVTGGFHRMDRDAAHAKLGIGYSAILNGGLYWLRHGTVAEAVFEAAREIHARGPELGLAPRMSDEARMGLAMGVAHRFPISDGGFIMRGLNQLRGSFDIDVIRGVCSFNSDDGPVEPAFLHFVGPHSGDGALGGLYRHEVARLKDRTPEPADLRRFRMAVAKRRVLGWRPHRLRGAR